MSSFLLIICFSFLAFRPVQAKETQLGMLHITGTVKNASDYNIEIKFLDNDNYEQTLILSSSDQGNDNNSFDKTVVINEGIYKITSVSSEKKMSYTLNSNDFKIKPNQTFNLKLDAVFNNKIAKTTQRPSVKETVAHGLRKESYKIFCNSWWVFLLLFAGIVWYCIALYKMRKN